MSLPKLVIAGASGVVGRHLIAAAKDRYDITVLTRSVDGDEGARAVAWNPRAVRDRDDAALEILSEELENSFAIINLAGASIGNGRLGPDHQARVLNSRVDSTETLITAFEGTVNRPQVWFNASATGYYGDRGNEVLDEASGPQDEFFLAKVVKHWEDATWPIRDDTRLLIGRFGLVLAKDADAWQRMIMPIKLFVGGPLGSGQQWYSWIDADDLARAILYLLEDDEARGVYNLTTPEPVRQADLAQKVAQKLGRPSVVPAPAFALKLILGGVADALLLPSAKVIPAKLLETGFEFTHPNIDSQLDAIL